MSPHLSEEQKSRWLLGEAGESASEHVRQCAACAQELMPVRDAISNFEHVMKDWSECEGGWKSDDLPDFATWRRPSHRRELKWVLTAAAAGLLLVPMYSSFDILQSPVPEKASTRTDEDVRLMDAVSAHLSRSVSAPMERVMALLPEEGLAMEMNEREEVR